MEQLPAVAAEISRIWVDQEDRCKYRSSDDFLLSFHSVLRPSPWDGAHIRRSVSTPTQSSLGTLSQTCPGVCLLADFNPAYSLRTESVLFLQHQVLLPAALLLLSKTKAGVFSPAHVAARALGVAHSLYVSGRPLESHPYCGAADADTHVLSSLGCSLKTELQAVGCGLDGYSTLLLALNSWPLNHTFYRLSLTYYPVLRGLSLREREWVPLLEAGVHRSGMASSEAVMRIYCRPPSGSDSCWQSLAFLGLWQHNCHLHMALPHV